MQAITFQLHGKRLAMIFYLRIKREKSNENCIQFIVKIIQKLVSDLSELTNVDLNAAIDALSEHQFNVC